MSLIFMDGCDHYGDKNDALQKWTAASTSANYSSTGGRFGGGALTSTADDNYWMLTIPNTTTFIISFYWRTDASTVFGQDTFLLTRATSNMLGLETNTNGTVRLERAGGLLETSTQTLPKDQWVYMEFKATISNTGSAELRVDGEKYIDFTGDTEPGSGGIINEIWLGNVQTSGSNFFDDVIVMNDSGAKNNTFLGETKIETVYPTADTAQADFTPLGGGSNFSEVDDGDAGPDDDTTHVESSTAGHKDLYTMGDLTTAAINSVIAVQSVTFAKKDDAGARTARNLVKTGTTTSNGASIALGTGYSYFTDILEDDPDTATDWTEAGVNGAEVGHEVLT